MNSKYLQEDVRRAIRILRKSCPLELPLRVRSVTQQEFKRSWKGEYPERGMWGDSYYMVSESPGASYVVLRIARTGPIEAILDTLFHEWAHLLDRGPFNVRKRHRRSWGISYSKVYDAYERAMANE